MYMVLQMNASVPQVLTIEQFVEEYGLGRTCAYAEIAAGRLKTMKFGRCTRIARTDADAWLEARRSEGGLPSYRSPSHSLKEEAWPL